MPDKKIQMLDKKVQMLDKKVQMLDKFKHLLVSHRLSTPDKFHFSPALFFHLKGDWFLSHGILYFIQGHLNFSCGS